MPEYKIIATIKGKKYTLNKVGEPRDDEPIYFRKMMLKGYVCKQFDDLIDTPDDLSQIVYKLGRKSLFTITYK